MTILTSANGSLPLTLRKGETLVIRNYSGAETVTGSSAEKEEASAVLGAGAVVYGPQSVASSIIISTTGQLDYSTVMGDVTPGFVSGTRAAKLRAAIERARAGVSPLLIALDGDSNTTGTGAGTGGAFMIGAQRWSVGAQLADILDSSFMYTTNDCFFGDQNATASGVTVQQFDPRFAAFGAGWSQEGSPSTFGGRCFIGAAGGAGALTFTPRRQWDRVRLFMRQFSGGATAITVKAGAGTIGTVSNRGSLALFDQTISTGATAAVQAFSLDTVTGGPAEVVGAIFWDSQNPGCVVCPGGWYSGTIANLNDTSFPASYRNFAVAMNAGLHITNATINNADAGTAIATYTVAALAFHQAIAATSDVLITGMTPSFTGSSVAGRLDEYEGALDSIASDLGVAFDVIDWRDQFGPTYAAANAAGWMADGAHLKGVGYARQAALYARAIQSVAQGV